MTHRKKRFKPEDARNCREAVTLALILARTWGQDLFVCTSVRFGPRYAIFDGPGGLPENDRGRLQHFRFRPGIVAWIDRTFDECHVARCIDEALELAIRHRVAINPESADTHPVSGCFLRVVAVRSHQKGPAGDQSHALDVGSTV